MSATQLSKNESASSAPVCIETPPPNYWQRWETGARASAAEVAPVTGNGQTATVTEIPTQQPAIVTETVIETSFQEHRPPSAFLQPENVRSGASNEILLNNTDLIEYYSETTETTETPAHIVNDAQARPLPQQSDAPRPADREIVALVPDLDDMAIQEEKNQRIPTAAASATGTAEQPAVPSPAPIEPPPRAPSSTANLAPGDTLHTVAYTAPTFTATATVPLASLTPDPNASISVPSSSESVPPRVLIVEDDRAQALFAQSILLGAGIQSEVQMDSSKTIESINKYAPDLVLMDLHMPEIDGMNLTTLIRQQPGFQFLPIILLTGDQNPELEITALDIGVDDFLNKPIRPRHLIATVSSRIKRARQQTTKKSATIAATPAPAAAVAPPAAQSPAPSRATAPATAAKAGLTTRSHLLQLTDEALQHKHSGALFFVEIMETAALREQYGYVSFERLLAEAGQQIADAVTPQPLARLGDNGFLIFMSDEKAVDLDAYARQLNQRITSQTFRIRGNLTTKLQSVIGYASLSQGFNDAGSALEAIERCTLQARESPDHVARYRPIHLDRKAQEEHSLLLEGSLELAYQPIVTVNGNSPVQYQALLRIRKPDGTSLPAGDIIPAAEAAGRIADFDQTILDRAIASIAKHHGTNPTLRLFVSQSPRTLARDSYADWLLHRISANGIDSKSVVIDLRLVDALTNTVTVGNFCRRLTAVGIQFCLNQFEPSREANSLLQWLPLSFIRLSPQFANLHNDPKLAAELRNLVMLAHKHDLQVIGQQVESQEAAMAMRSAGVDFIQGNLFHSVGSELNFDFQKPTL